MMANKQSSGVSPPGFVKEFELKAYDSKREEMRDEVRNQHTWTFLHKGKDDDETKTSMKLVIKSYDNTYLEKVVGEDLDIKDCITIVCKLGSMQTKIVKE